MRLGKPSFSKKLTYLLQMLAGIRIIAVARTAVPEAIFIELDALGICSAEYHRPQPSVADGKRFPQDLDRLLRLIFRGKFDVETPVVVHRDS